MKSLVLLRTAVLCRGVSSSLQRWYSQKPYGKPTSYKQSIWQGVAPPEQLKPGEFWPSQAPVFKPKIGLMSKTPKEGRRILVGVDTPDWAGSVCAVRTAFALCTNEKDEVYVYSVPKMVTDLPTQLAQGAKAQALVKAIQEIATQQPAKKKFRIELAEPNQQPKVELVKKIATEDIDLVIIGNGRYPPNALGNVASYVALNAPCDVLVVKGGAVTE